MKLSLVLPSIFPNAFKRTLDNIVATTRNVDYEVLAVTPFEAAGANVRWVREDTPKGNVAANAAGYEHASGDILVALADDSLLADGWADAALSNLVAHEGQGTPVCLGLHQANLIVGTVFGIYYPFFPVIRKSAVEQVGGYYDRAYIARFGDPDLALRVWRTGGRCARTERPLIDRVARQGAEMADPSAKSQETLRLDLSTFVARWAAIYGQGWDTSAIGGFNLDVDALFELMVGRGRSIFFNDPLFARLHANYRVNVALLQEGRKDQPKPDPTGP